MEGLGNEFVVLRGPVAITGQKVAQYCNRETGIGADGVLVVTPESDSEVRMEYWNADGSKAEMCGNGLRCTARYAVENNLVRAGTFIVHTPAGQLQAVWDGKDENQIEVQVGVASVDDEALQILGIDFYKANVGNPHAITYVDSVYDYPVGSIGSKVEVDTHFPHRTNVEFIEIVSPTAIKMRVWERGVGETMACGTGMVAAAIATRELRGGTLPMEVSVPGGIAKIWIDQTGFSRMKASAHIISTGSL